MIVTAASIAALQVGWKGNFQTAYTATREAAAWARVATLIRSSRKAETYGWLGKFPKMREWVGPRVHLGMDSEAYTVANKKYEATVDVERTDIEDDALGHISPLMQEMGASAGNHPDRNVFSLLNQGRTTPCYDGQNFFDADHPGFDENGAEITVSNVDADGDAGNPWWYVMDTTRPLKPLFFQERQAPRFVLKNSPTTSDRVFELDVFSYGVDCRDAAGFGFWQMAHASNRPLDGEELDRVIELMRTQKDSNGDPLGINPDLLVVGPRLRAAGRRTVKVMLGEGGASNSNYEALDFFDSAWVA